MKVWQQFGIDTKWAWLVAGLAALVLLLSIKGFYGVLRFNINVADIDLDFAYNNQKPTIAHPALFGHDRSGRLPVSDLRLSLKGIFSSDDAEKGAAIIATNGRNPLLYVVGDTLPGGATLVEVHSSEVILQEAQEQTILKLPQKRL